MTISIVSIFVSIAAQIGWTISASTESFVVLAPAKTVFQFREGTPLSVCIRRDRVDVLFDTETITELLPARSLIAQMTRWVVTHGEQERISEENARIAFWATPVAIRHAA